MGTKERLNSLLTKRSLVVVVVVIAVVGTGFGFVSPPSNDSVGDSGGFESQNSKTTKFSGGQTAEEASRGVTTTTESAPDRELADDATDRTRTGDEETTTTTRSTTRSAPEASDDGFDERDEDARDGGQNGDASVTVHFEGNATVGSLSDYPSMSLTLNAVVNAPNAASTAGGA